MTTRPATLADVPLIRELALATWPVAFAELLSPAQIEYMLEMMYAPAALRAQVTEQGHAFLIALDDAGAPRGYASYQLDYAPGVAKLHKLYVLPATQGGGFGRGLVKAVAKTAHAAGHARLRLDVNRDNPAIAFYRRLGFAQVGEAVTDIGNGFVMDDYSFELPLGPDPGE